MKSKLLKVIGILFLIYVVLSWIIPVGMYSGGEVTTNGIDPVGLIDLFNTPIQAFLTFFIYCVVFIAIGGLYGVLDKTGALEKFTNSMEKVFKGKEKVFLIITIVLFTILSSLTGLILPLFILVPLFAAVLFALGYDKLTVMASTVGSLLVGTIASTYGFNFSGYASYLLSLDASNQIVAKCILLVILTVALIFVTLMPSKKAKEKELKEPKMKKDEVKKAPVKKEVKASAQGNSKKTSKTGGKTTSKKTTKKTSSKTTTKKTKTNTKAFAVSKPVKKVSEKSKVSALPMVIIFLLMLIICLVGMYTWSYYGIEVFNDIHEAIMGVEIKDFPIFEHLLSSISALGSWTYTELIGSLIIGAIVIGWIYKLSLNDIIDSFASGAKKWLPTAVLSVLACTIFYSFYYALSYGGSGTLLDTIDGTIMGLADGFNVLVVGAITLISSLFLNDFPYLVSFLQSFISGFDVASLPVAGLLIQGIYGIAMLIFPTSVFLIAGLSLFEVSYKEWMKYIWKFALVALLLVLLVCGIITLL